MQGVNLHAEFSFRLWQRKNREAIQEKVNKRLMEDEEVNHKQTMGMYARVSTEMWQEISEKEKEEFQKLAKELNEGKASDEEKRK